MIDLDESGVKRLALDLIAAAEARWEDSEVAFIRSACVIIEIDTGDASTVLSSCSDDRVWFQRAFLEHAIDSLDEALEALRDDGA